MKANFLSRALLLFVWLLLLASPCFGMIGVGPMSKEEAGKLGIVMKSRPNGDAGTLVWVEFKKTDFLEKFTYAELEMVDAAGKHRLSAKLLVNPVVYQQPADVISVSFSAEPEELAHCSIMLVAYGSSRGDVGEVLQVKDHLDLAAVKAEQEKAKKDWDEAVKRAKEKEEAGPDPAHVPGAGGPPASGR
ncbi:hypothetical protein [Haloferula sp. BvORR071]|uniref:hypothetical protein n=1 Tax=Haloferula sp. BvORR071 TaxID=1396141 RepID=UPI0005515E82|nr:hypothetical protein [Haloferula sp. BvORR071]